MVYPFMPLRLCLLVCAFDGHRRNIPRSGAKTLRPVHTRQHMVSTSTGHVEIVLTTCVPISYRKLFRDQASRISCIL